MKAFRVQSPGVWLLIGLLAVGLVGCSTDAPIESTDTASSSLSIQAVPPPPVGRVLFVAVVATVDLDQRMLTFVDRDETVIAAEDCLIVEIVAAVDTEIEFADIEVGDRLKVCGWLQEDETVLAHKICLYSGEEFCQYDLAFRDTISTIDYAAGSFTVNNRTEAIVVDENTVIFGVVPVPQNGPVDDVSGGLANSTGTRQSEGPALRTRRVQYEFSDLVVGDVLEVKANIVDENTLYAASIKLANSVERVCTEFESILASVDYTERIVTFEDNDWIGTVCPRAQLLDAAGEPLTLEDFVSGEAVYVKGLPTSDDALKICVMSKLD